jgi:hypothetical protein
MSQLAWTCLSAAPPNHSAVQLSDLLPLQAVYLFEQSAHILLRLCADQQLRARCQGAPAAIVRDPVELSPVSAACATLTNAGYESFREERIIARRENRSNLPLNPTKIVEPVGVGP